MASEGEPEDPGSPLSEETVKEIYLNLLHIKVESVWTKFFLENKPLKSSAAIKREVAEIRKAVEPIFNLQKALGGRSIENKVRSPIVARDEFVQWANKMGIERNNIEIAYDDERGFYLKATGPIEENSLLVTIPRKAIITISLAKKSKFFKRCLKEDLWLSGSSERFLMATYICFQKLLPDSSWQPYFNIMPEAYDIPLYYTDEDLKVLSPSPALDEILTTYHIMVRHWLWLLRETIILHQFENKRPWGWEPPKEPPCLYGTPVTPSNVTFELYRWCTAQLIARAASEPSREERPNGNGNLFMTLCFSPVLDLLRQEPDPLKPSTRLSLSPRDEYKIFAARSYSCGEEITFNRAQRCCAYTLSSLGYLPKVDVKHTMCRIKLGFSQSNIYYEARLRLMNKFCVAQAENVYFFYLSAKPPCFPAQLVYFSRIHVYCRPDLIEVEELDDPDVVIRGWEFLEERMKLMARALKYSGPLEELTERQKKILELRLAEQKIYEAAMFFCARILEKLLSNDRFSDEADSDSVRDHSSGESGVFDVNSVSKLSLETSESTLSGSTFVASNSADKLSQTLESSPSPSTSIASSD